MIAVKEGKEVFLSSFPTFNEEGRLPLRRLRKAALERFAALELPTLKDEEWRFTNLSALLKVPFEPGSAAGHRPWLRHQGPPLPAGVVLCSLAEALDRHADLVEPYLARLADYEENAFTALNTAYLCDGAFVFIPEGTVVEAPLYLTFMTAASSSPQVWQRRSLIVAGPHSQARIVESYDGTEGMYFTNAVTEVVAGEKSVLDYYRLQRESREAFHIATVQVRQEYGSSFTSFALALGGVLARTDLNVVLDAEDCECTLNGLYLADDAQLIDNHTRIDHARPHCTSHELYKGILDGRARGVFNGKIHVHPQAQKTDAKQTNKTLLLSDEAMIDAKPQLEIYADDVKCTHGASIGQLDEEQIFYLRTRGIDRESARALLTRAFANDILSRIRIDALRTLLEEELFTSAAQTGQQPVGEVP